jgi:hypothetical protein
VQVLIEISVAIFSRWRTYDEGELEVLAETVPVETLEEMATDSSAMLSGLRRQMLVLLKAKALSMGFATIEGEIVDINDSFKVFSVNTEAQMFHEAAQIFSD